MIFSIAMGADYSFYVKSIATYAPAFLGYNNSVLARVREEGKGWEVMRADTDKVIIEKSRGEVSPMGQDTIENVS